MTAPASADRAAASRLVAALEHAWTAIRSHHPDVPPVVVLVASGSDPRGKRLNLGHFAAGRWQLTHQPTDRAEVLVSGEGLQRGPHRRPRHPAARGRPRSGLCPQGQRHQPPRPLPQPPLRHPGRRARPGGGPRAADRLVSHQRPEPTAAHYGEVLAELAAALVLWRRAEQAARAGPATP